MKFCDCFGDWCLVWVVGNIVFCFVGMVVGVVLVCMFGWLGIVIVYCWKYRGQVIGFEKNF